MAVVSSLPPASVPPAVVPASAGRPPLTGARLTWYFLQGQLARYRRVWRGSIISSVLSPLLFLAAMGVSLGRLVDHGPRASSFGVTGSGHPVTYLLFVAPGLLAATAMQTAIGESTYPVLGSLRWERTYTAAIVSPLSPATIYLGHQLWMLFRIALTSTCFFLVMVLFGAVRFEGPLGLGPVFALLASFLLGAAFTAPIAAWAITQTRDAGFAIVFRFIMIPLFLFSGTFFPVSQLPAVIQPLAYATPLWHGVDLCRSLALGTATVGSVLGHVAYLVGVIGIGLWYGSRTFRRRLNP
jgi:lipooligosaccharide transport system permease protein